jgi:lipoteichoic acid synthase
MKNILGLLLFTLSFYPSLASPGNDTVVQEIRYSCKGAENVVLVWGVDNWQVPEEKLWPAGSYSKEGLLYTPMENTGNCFSSSLRVLSGTKIDYVFWINKAPLSKKVELWDLNIPGKDYHTVALQNGITLIESSLIVKPKEAITILDFSTLFLTVPILLLAVITVLWRFKRINVKQPVNSYLVILSGSFLLMSLLFLIRPSVSGISWDLYYAPLRYLPRMLKEGVYDFLFVSIHALIFLVLAWLFKKYYKAQILLSGVFVVTSCAILLAGLVNIRVVELLGKPFSYPWLYYSDFLKSADAKSALSANLPAAYVSSIVKIIISLALCIPVAYLILNFIWQRVQNKKIILASLVTAAAAYVITAFNKIENRNINYNKLSNPVTAFVGSLGVFSEDIRLFNLEIPDSLKLKKEPGKDLADARDTSFRKLKNVIVFVLESTPAEYVDLYNSKYNITPELQKHAEDALIFENVYAHAPATNLSLVSILGSVYPWLSYNSVTQEHPDLKIPTISSELKKYGYATAFFNSADNRFQKAGKFLAHRKFDSITDCNNSECGRKKFAVQDDRWKYLDGKDDQCTADQLTDWIKGHKKDPFFAMMWTYETHYPYFVSGEEKNIDTSDPSFNRYLNALHHSDSIIGALINRLKDLNLYESTLLVVVGDHGEAFGRHNQITHASGIYEENLHVPCIFINPAFKSQRNSSLGGLIDIAPSIMHLLGLPASPEWQGSNLLSSAGERVYFFSPWSDFLFGYREKNLKYIFNATTNTTEIYDLSKDPLEATNISSSFPERSINGRLYLAAWVQYVNRFMEDKLGAKEQ